MTARAYTAEDMGRPCSVCRMPMVAAAGPARTHPTCDPDHAITEAYLTRTLRRLSGRRA